MTYDKQKEELIRVCHAIHSKGMVSGSGGNVSIKVDGGILITASGVSLENTTEENIVFVDDREQFSSRFRPSKETALHLRCYAVRSDIMAVVHVHSVYSVALSCMKDIQESCIVPAYTPGYGIRVGKLPVIPYFCPGSEKLAMEVSSYIAGRNSVLMRNHGLVAVGKTLDEALNLAEEIEENAKIHFILNGNGCYLSDAQIDELHENYH